MRELTMFQVDAFTRRPFGGNPAAVVLLEEGPWLGDGVLGAIASENNLSETAFLRPRADGFDLRWFTPTVEVALCGHATLASAHVVLHHLTPEADRVRFESQSGPLLVHREGDRLRLDFPRLELASEAVDPALGAALGATPKEQLRGSKGGEPTLVAVFAEPAEVAALSPDFRALERHGALVIATAPDGGEADYVVRCFAPAHGIDEDPVTGSAQCSVAPLWAERLRPDGEMRCHQISRRRGELWTRVVGERVHIAGYAVEYLRGTIRVADAPVELDAT